MRYVILSTNENPEYLYYLPLVAWAWERLGWTPILFYTGDCKFVKSKVPVELKFKIEAIDGYRSDTIAQVSRLYGGTLSFMGDPIIMTGDIDMMPLSNYWNPKDGDITLYGHDLTDFNHYPICYIAMNATRWTEVMGTPGFNTEKWIKRDLDSYPQAKESFDSLRRWVVDQDMITERLNAVQFKKEHVSRGVLPNGYAFGRVDRSAWHLNHPVFIDCHLPRSMYVMDTNFRLVLDMLQMIWPQEDWEWFVEYTKSFKLEFVKTPFL